MGVRCADALPPEACRTFRWSTVICRISAFSSLAEPFKSIQFNTTFQCNQSASPLCPNLSHLFLYRCGDQPSELWQAVIDSVSASFLNNLIRNQRLITWPGFYVNGAVKDKLTPLRFFLSFICEVGEPRLRYEALIWLKRNNNVVKPFPS